MTFGPDPNQPDFAAIYAGGASPPQPNLNDELSRLGVTSLDGLNEAQLMEIATRLEAQRKSDAAVASNQAESYVQQQRVAQGLDPGTGLPVADTQAAAPAAAQLDPAAWLAYLQKVGPDGYGGNPQDYANAIYDAHYQVAQAGGTGTKPADSGATEATAPAEPGTVGAAAPAAPTRTASGAVTDATMARLEGYITNLRAAKNPTAGQNSELARYTARQSTYAGQNAEAALKVSQPGYQPPAAASASTSGPAAATPVAAPSVKQPAPVPKAPTAKEALAAIAARSPGASAASVAKTLANDLAKGISMDRIVKPK